MLDQIKQNILSQLINFKGWKTNRKIVVIESDDWGSIRIPSRETYEYFLRKGYPVDKSPYNRFDALESESDLLCLFEVLLSVKDNKGNPAIITANNIVANPDFKRIEASGFKEYFFEPFTESYNHYPEHTRSFELMKKGLSENLFFPQFHGREHLNVKRWINALQGNDPFAHEAFKHNMFSLHFNSNSAYVNEFMDALDIDSSDDTIELQKILTEGANLFEKTWGFRSKSFIASCYIWGSNLEPVLKGLGVDYLQSALIQLVPTATVGRSYKKKFHYLGQRSKSNQLYLIRNVTFEPSQNPSLDWVGKSIKEISLSFKRKKPAIISSHRLNYIGFIDAENRSRNLTLLKSLLLEIKKQWPDVEFMTSVQLGDIITNSTD